MTIEGRIRHRNGKMFVVYTTTLSSEPRRLIRWWRVIEPYSNRYSMARPEDGDLATHTSGAGAVWNTSNRNGSTGRVEVEDQATLEEVGVEPPRSGGKQLRWNDGRWEKLMAKGWIPAGEGGPGDPNNPIARTSKAPRKKSGAQLDAEIADALKVRR